MDYYAHTYGEDQSQWQPLREHLENVAKLAEKFAREARPGDEAFAYAAYTAGLLHDLGKYRPEFQEYIDPRHQREASTDTHHAVYGAATALHSDAIRAAFAVAGHHSGLHDLSELDALVQKSRYSAQTVFPGLVMRAQGEIASWQNPLGDCEPVADREKLKFEFSTRVLFSLLVDADRLDTARAERKALRLPLQPSPTALDAATLA